MKFLRLRLSGFKSFVDPTELLIEPGLTGIVGPNGCGKSNLLEGLRWVMGETSYKNLRGSAMDDVIFAGSAERPSRNTAEVTVALDNSERKAPAQFNSDDVIEVSRRIEREVGSAYRINGRDARARDVQMLFADAATGAHSVALVRQGQIGEVIAAKPQARRRILEEAAGIQGLHHRRHEAELRLRAAEQNLGRLDDVIGEIDNQLHALKRQARQASRYRRISTDIRKAEALLLHLRWTDAKAAREAAVTELAGARGAVEELTAQAASAITQETAASEKIAPLRQDEAEAAAALQRLTNEDRRLASEAESAEQRMREVDARLHQIDADMAREQAIAQDHAAQIQSLTAEDAAIAEQLAAQDGRRDEIEAAVSAAADALEVAEAQLTIRQTAMAEARAARTTAETTARESVRTVERLTAERASAETDIESLSAAELPDLTAHEKAIEDAAGLLAEIEQKSDAAARALEDARQAEVTARDALAEASRSADKLDAEITALEQVAELDTADADRIDARITVVPGYEKALSAALGDDLGASTVPGAPILWRELEPLASSEGLPDGAEPLAQFVNGPAALERRLAFTGVVDATDGDVLQRLLRPGQRLVSPEGHLWRWDGLYADAGAETAASRRLAARNRLTAVRPEFEAARQRREDAQSSLDQATAATREAVERETKTREAWRAAGQALNQAQTTLANSEQASRKTRDRLSALQQKRDRIASELEAAETTMREAATALDTLPSTESVESDAAPLRNAVADARNAFAEAKAAAESAERAAAEAEQRRQRLAQDVERATARAESARQQLGALEARREEARAQRDDLASLPDEIGDKRTQLADGIADAEKARAMAADRLARAEQELAGLTREARATESSLGQARESLARAEAVSEAADERCLLAEQTIREELSCPPEQVLALADLEPDDELPQADGLEERMHKLKAERERLGAVNLRAEEEAAEQENRATELRSEREDLEKAIRRLRQGIGELNSEARGRLVDAFDAVNGHFSALFKMLFGGGTAELSMTEADDPLEAGLEVVAKPPGKRAQTLTLLSGGEQALTALALILAVFRTNPSPICVLDEVDAPLDDANVERFCNLITALAHQTETRFLVITHHAYSMARMDRLFGVTMAERGVSQLVSVDLDTAERYREAG